MSEPFRYAPELAILAAAETTLALTAEVLSALYPEITDERIEPDDYSILVAEVACMTQRANELITLIRRYRDWIVDADPEIF